MSRKICISGLFLRPSSDVCFILTILAVSLSDYIHIYIYYMHIFWNSKNAMLFPKTKSSKFFDSTIVPCCLNWTPTINWKGKHPQEDHTAHRDWEGLMMLMLPLSVHRYECWERMVTQILPAVDKFPSPCRHKFHDRNDKIRTINFPQ